MKKHETLHQIGDELYFAVNLRKLRLTKSPRLSQARLAKKLGISRNTYASYESGKRLPPAWFVYNTANYFDVAIEELIGQEMKKKGLKNQE